MHLEHTLPTSQDELDLHRFSDNQLYELLTLSSVRMDLQVYEIDKHGALTETFKQARAKFNSIALEMNFRGKLMPSFRASMMVDPDMPSKAEQLHAKDLEAIELHWMQIHGNKASRDY